MHRLSAPVHTSSFIKAALTYGVDGAATATALSLQSVEKIAWFKDYIENTTLHPPFDDCVGDDDGYVHTLTCGTDYLLFHFYGTHPNASGSFRYINLPKLKGKMRQDLLQPWEMIITLIWEPPPIPPDLPLSVVERVRGSPPPPGVHVFGPKRDMSSWEPTGITVDQDTLPHVLTFTACTYKNACTRSTNVPGNFNSATSQSEAPMAAMLSALGAKDL
jgi:hypothetical protein